MLRRLLLWISLFAGILVLSFGGLVGPFDALILIVLVPRILDLLLSVLRGLGRLGGLRFLHLPYFFL